MTFSHKITYRLYSVVFQSLMERFRKTGSYEVKKNSGGAPRRLSEKDEHRIHQAINDRTGITLAEIKEKCNLQVILSTIHRTVVRIKVTIKKRCILRSKTAPGFSC